MRIITILTGAIFILGGLFLIAEEGISFMAVAFPVGLLFVLAGIIECLSYTSYRGDRESKTWILVDGIVTLVLGGLILANQIVSDAVVPFILGFWAITNGVRNFVRIIEEKRHKGRAFRAHLIIGSLNFLVGIYVFFDSELLNLAAIVLVALCIIVNGVNLINIGGSIRLKKPKFIKTKQELLAEAQAKMEEAHEHARVAIQAAKDARAEFTTIYETPESIIDATVAPIPTDEEVEQFKEKRRAARMTEEEIAETLRIKAVEEKAAEENKRADEIAAQVDAKAIAQKLLWEKRSAAAKKGAETKRKIAAQKRRGTYVEKVRTPEEEALWQKRSEAAKKGAETKRKMAEAIANGTYVEPTRTPEEEALWQKRSEAAKRGAETKRQIAIAKANGTYVEPTRTPEEEALWQKRSEAAKRGAETKRRMAEEAMQQETVQNAQ